MFEKVNDRQPVEQNVSVIQNKQVKFHYSKQSS